MSMGQIRVYANLDGRRIALEGASLCPECGALVWDVVLHIAFHEGRPVVCTCAISPSTGTRYYDDQCPIHEPTEREQGE